MLPVLLFGRNFTENPIVLSGQPRHYLHCDGAVLVNNNIVTTVRTNRIIRIN